MPSRYAELDRAQLAALVPELLLTGHLIDRAGMAYAIGAFGQEGMQQVAIEEWMGASPIYTKRMQRALDFVGDDVVTIFKGMQLEIGAPPQFMDFRYGVTDPKHGTFHLDYCGALMDVEPMGPDYVKGMCHDIEDPTFDATAVATNPRARMRPIHRPPRTPADRHPHCSWTVEIDDAAEPVQPSPALAVIAQTAAATLELDPIDPTDEGADHYNGDLVGDIDFAAFSRSALARIADEVTIQMHLLNLSFNHAIRQRTDETDARGIAVRQLIGHGGLTAERLHRVLGLGSTPEDAARLIELHPAMNPSAYVELERDGATLQVRPSKAHSDRAWLSLCGPSSPEPLRAIVRAASPYLDVEFSGTDDHWTAAVFVGEVERPEPSEVEVAKFSKGATFRFEPRHSLPIYPVGGTA
jgi:hypothetical protein